MGKKEFNRNAVEWQLEGHRLKFSTHNILITLIVATIGFSINIAMNCECNKNILMNCFATPVFFVSLLLQFISLVFGFVSLRKLQLICFEYSSIQGKLGASDDSEKESKDAFNSVLQQHTSYYKNFILVSIIYCSSILLLIASILIVTYKS